MLLIQLLWYTFLMVFAFVSIMYIIGRKFKGLSPDEAEKEVKDLLLWGFGMLKKEEIEPIPTDILRDKCFDIMKDRLMLKRNATDCEPCNEFGFYALRFRVALTYNEENFQLVKALLEECILNHFRELNFDSLSYVYYEQFDDNKFYFFVCYACTSECKNNLSNYVKNRKNIAFNKAVAREKPVLDDKLEKELQDLK